MNIGRPGYSSFATLFQLPASSFAHLGKVGEISTICVGSVFTRISLKGEFFCWERPGVVVLFCSSLHFACF